MLRSTLSILCAFLSALCALCGYSQIDEGYIGARVVDNASGQTVFSWFYPGPLDGAGLQSNPFDLHRPDVLKSVDGKAMNAEEFNAYIKSLAPGTQVVIEYVKAAQRDTANIPETVATDGEAMTITVVLESKEEYTGTIGRPRSITREIEFTDPPLLDPFDPQNVLGAAVAEHRLQEEIERLLKVFDDTIEETTDTHMLSHVRAAFQEPFRLADQQLLLQGELQNVLADPFEGSLRLAASMLDVEYVPDVVTSRGIGVWDWVSSRVHHRAGIALASLPRDPHAVAHARDLLRVPRDSFYISGSSAKASISAINNSAKISFGELVSALEPADRVIGRNGGSPESVGINLPIPEELRALVDGQVLRASMHDEGWIVYGSDDANRYDMSRIFAVVDPGGDDEYYASDLCIGNRIIIDLAGNDTYTGTPDQGPGSAILGVSFIDDRAGNDTYNGELLSCGAAIYGVSLLLDRGGDDTYSGTDWSMGAAVYGAGMLIDLGDGNDTYTGEFLCQGVGGPRGFGAIIDEGGDDVYRANGPQPSMYGTPGVFASFSQGVGFGYRNYAAGGIGMLSDLGGNDRYESGEFSQGGAYYFALGILHDAAGNDEYIGNRYGQGFGVHQAFGILADDAGDDVYKSVTAASQGAAWDIGAGLLIDRAGNDSYTCDGLGQGGASMQGIAMLVDLGGDDRYNASGGATQGESGGNSYHFAETGAFSFSLLWDEGGGVDFFSRGRENNKVTSTGVVNEADPANSGAHGLVIDR